MRFTDRVVIVTGGASGIGLATAKRFGSEGARVGIADLHQDKAEAAAREVRESGAPDALVVACNVARKKHKSRPRWPKPSKSLGASTLSLTTPA